MIDLKRPKPKPRSPVVEPSIHEEAYAYGLRIRLENHELDKLNLTLPQVGQTVQFEVMADVISVHENKRASMAGEEADRSVELQITAIDMNSGDD